MSELPMGEDDMTLKNIGVFVDATPEGEKRIDYAAALAYQCGAHLAGIHVVSAVRPEYRSDYYVIGEKATRARGRRIRRPDEGRARPLRRRARSETPGGLLRREPDAAHRRGPPAYPSRTGPAPDLRL